MGRLSSDRLRELLDAIREVRVLVVGDVMLDRYLVGRVDRISPEAPVPVVQMEEESSAVGGAGNVAANIVALGAACDLVGCIGRDVYGRMLTESMEAGGVATRGIVATDERPTTVKTRVLARRQQVVRVDQEVDADVTPTLAPALEKAVRELAPACDALVLEDYNKGVLVEGVIQGALAAGAEEGVPTVVDPKRIRFFEYRGATVFKPNAKELADALRARLRPEDPDWMESTRKHLESENLLVTLGEEGMVLQGGDGQHVRIPTVAREVYDVSGAGDTVTAAVAAALAAGASPTEAAILSNHAAAIEVGKAGVATVSPDEIVDHHEDVHTGGREDRRRLPRSPIFGSADE